MTPTLDVFRERAEGVKTGWASWRGSLEGYRGMGAEKKEGSLLKHPDCVAFLCSWDPLLS